MMRFIELAAPQIKRHSGEVVLFAGHQVVGHQFGDGLNGACLEPVERRRNDFFGIPMEFDEEGRQEREGVAA
jgi:hypothetical protein